MHKCVYAPISEIPQCLCPVRLESQVKQNDLSEPNLVKERKKENIKSARAHMQCRS